MPEDLISLSNADEVKVHYTRYHGHAIDLAQQAADDGASLIIAIGGDGTFFEVLNGIMKSSNKEVKLAIIPNGTGNDFCRGQNIVYTKENFLKAYGNATFKRYDIVKTENSLGTSFYFNIADIGFGGYTARILNRQRSQGIKGLFSYSLAIIRSFAGYIRPEASVFADNRQVFKGQLMMVAVCNGSTFAGGLVIHPGARADDGMLNLTILGKVSLLDYATNLFNLKSGFRIKHAEISYYTAKKVTVKVHKGFAPSEADGEVTGDGSASFDILPSCIHILDY